MQLTLTNTEQLELEECEAIIERGLRTFVDVGQALQTIRHRRLYKRDYSTFEEYCEQRWNITPQHARRLIGAVEVHHNLEPIGSILPSSESQVRPLVQLPPAAQPIVWERAGEN